MKRKNLVLLFVVLFVGTFLFSGCSTQKNYNMSYEQVISLLESQTKEMMEMLFDFNAQQRDLILSTKVDVDGTNLDVDIQSQSKIDYDSKVQDMDMSFAADVKIPESELDFTTSGAVKYSLIGDDMYLKLSKFSLGGPSAKDLAMVTMIVNGFKGQRFKLNMSGVSISKAFDLYNMYNEKLGGIADNIGAAMINEGTVVYDGMFDEYKGYNARKYSIDEEKFDEMLRAYADIMNEFYSGLFAQYVQNLGNDEIEFPDFNAVLSGITYDNLQGYFVIVGKNNIVEIMEDAHVNIDGTGIVVNYYYGKDGLYFEAKTEDGYDMMLIMAKKNGKIYDVYVSMASMLEARGDIKFNQFSKKLGVDVDFNLDFLLDIEQEDLGDNLENTKELTIKIPFKGNYKVKNIDKFSLQEPKDAVDLMEMLGGFIGSVDEQIPDDFELAEEYDNEELISNN